LIHDTTEVHGKEVGRENGCRKRDVSASSAALLPPSNDAIGLRRFRRDPSMALLQRSKHLSKTFKPIALGKGNRVESQCAHTPTCDSHIPNVNDLNDSDRSKTGLRKMIEKLASESSQIVHNSEGGMKVIVKPLRLSFKITSVPSSFCDFRGDETNLALR